MSQDKFVSLPECAIKSSLPEALPLHFDADGVNAFYQLVLESWEQFFDGHKFRGALQRVMQGSYDEETIAIIKTAKEFGTKVRYFFATLGKTDFGDSSSDKRRHRIPPDLHALVWRVGRLKDLLRVGNLEKAQIVADELFDCERSKKLGFEADDETGLRAYVTQLRAEIERLLEDQTITAYDLHQIKKIAEIFQMILLELNLLAINPCENHKQAEAFFKSLDEWLTRANRIFADRKSSQGEKYKDMQTRIPESAKKSLREAIAFVTTSLEAASVSTEVVS